MIEQILLALAEERRAAYQPPTRRGAAADRLAAHRRAALHRYVDAAARLGSKQWQPIEALATSALAGGRRDLAVDVFRAADAPGWHREHLRTRCLALTGERLDDHGPTLRVVD